MKRISFAIYCALLITPPSLTAGQPAPVDAQAAANRLASLLEQQASNPDDAIINYNVGVAQYRAHQYASAAKNFMRAHKNAGDDKPLEKRAQFNTAKSLELETLAGLPENWEDPKVDVDDKLLTSAISTMENACSWYKKDMSDEKTHKNLDKAEETLEKLKRKKKQEQQKQDKKDKDKKDDKDDKKDQDKKDNKDSKNDQKQDGSDQSNQGKDGSDNQQSADNQQQKNNQQNKDQKNRDENEKSSDNAVKNDQKKDDEEKNERGGQQKPQPSDQQGKEGDQQKANGKDAAKNKGNSEQSTDHEQPQGSDAQEQSSGGNSTDGEDKKQESMQERRMHAVLENLQASEGKQQKALISQQLQGNQQPQQTGQKPW